MSLAMPAAAVAFFSLMAFWKSNALLFMLSAGASLMLGFHWYNVYVTNIGLSIGILFIAYSFVCLGLAFKYIFWRDRLREE